MYVSDFNSKKSSKVVSVFHEELHVKTRMRSSNEREVACSVLCIYAINERRMIEDHTLHFHFCLLSVFLSAYTSETSSIDVLRSCCSHISVHSQVLDVV